MRAAEHQERAVLSWPEKVLQQNVVSLAKALGWWTHHHYDSRRSTPGWPDLVMLRGERALFVELKREKGRTTPDQRDVIARLTNAGLDARIWRPSDWVSQEVHRELGRDEKP